MPTSMASASPRSAIKRPRADGSMPNQATMSALIPVNDCAPLTFPTLTSSDTHQFRSGSSSLPLQAPLAVERNPQFSAHRATDAAERVRRICAINVQAAARALVWVHPTNSTQRETALLHRLYALFSLESGISDKFIAQESSVSYPMIRQYFTGRMSGNQDVVEVMLTRFMDLYVRGVFDTKLSAMGKPGLSTRHKRTKKMKEQERCWEQTLIKQIFTKYAEIAREHETVKIDLVSTAALSVERLEGEHSPIENVNVHYARARQFRQQLYMLQQQKIIMEQQERLIIEQNNMLKRSAPLADPRKQPTLSTVPPSRAGAF